MDNAMIQDTPQDIEDFNPLKNHLNPDAPFDGCMYETYGPELEYVIAQPIEQINHLWTIIEGDIHTWFAPGYHLVNRLGYIITQIPWQDGQEDIMDEWDPEDNND